MNGREHDLHGEVITPPSLSLRSTYSDNFLTKISYVAAGLCLVLITISAGLRFYAKQNVWKSIDMEDYLCVVAWLCVVGSCVGAIIYTAYGGCHNIWELDAAQIRFTRHVFYALALLYVFAVLCIKVLLLAILIRFFTPRENMALLIRGLTTFVVVYYVVIVFVRIFMCSPASAFWDGNGKCLNLDAIFITDSFISLITDGAILILPIILAYPLHLPLQKKIKVAAILGAGGLVTISNIYRIVLSFSDWGVMRPKSPGGYAARLILTGVAEMGIGLICSCLPAISGLINHKLRQRFSRSSEANQTDLEATLPPSGSSEWGSRTKTGREVGRVSDTNLLTSSA